MWRLGLKAAAAQLPIVIIVLIPRGDRQIYSVRARVSDACVAEARHTLCWQFVKHQTVVDNAIITQCVDTSSISSRPGQPPKKIMPIVGNCFKQIMAKLGHTLWAVDLGQEIKVRAACSPAALC